MGIFCLTFHVCSPGTQEGMLVAPMCISSASGSKRLHHPQEESCDNNRSVLLPVQPAWYRKVAQLTVFREKWMIKKIPQYIKDY